MKLSETEIREEVHRLAKQDERRYWERAIDHFQKTGRRIYCEYGVQVVVSDWSIARNHEIHQKDV